MLTIMFFFLIRPIQILRPMGDVLGGKKFDYVAFKMIF